MDTEELKALWAILGGSANQDVSDSVFATAAEFLEMQGWDIIVDATLEPADLYYQEWNTQACAVISVLDAIAKGRLTLPVSASMAGQITKILPEETDDQITARWYGSGPDGQALRDNGIRD
jgi:hypothetical protein